MRTILTESKLPSQFWVDASFYAVYTINRLPTPIFNGISPFEKLFGKPPDYSFLKVFGCECFPNISARVSHKLAPLSIQCVFLGYAPNYKGYRCLDPKTGRVYISRHVLFHELRFSYSELVNPAAASISLPASSNPLVVMSLLHSIPTITSSSPSHISPTISSSPVVSSISNNPSSESNSSVPPTSSNPPISSTSVPHISSPSPTPSTSVLPLIGDLPTSPSLPNHPMQTRLKSGITKPCQLLSLNTTHEVEPSCFSQAVKNPKWQQAMADEFNALLEN